MEKSRLQQRLDELRIINPNNLECSSCNNYPGWTHNKCKSINPLFFCIDHTGLMKKGVKDV